MGESIQHIEGFGFGFNSCAFKAQQDGQRPICGF